MQDPNEDPLYEKLIRHLARISYTATSLRATPDGFSPETLGEMAEDICNELKELWRSMGCTDEQIAEADERAGVDAVSGLARQWKPYEKQ